MRYTELGIPTKHVNRRKSLSVGTPDPTRVPLQPAQVPGSPLSQAQWELPPAVPGALTLG